MKTKILLILSLAAATCQAQTKLIAHKSHSGSSQSFAKAYQQNLFDINRSNFGDPGTKPIMVLDTVIAVNDTLTLLKMRQSTTCYRWFTNYTDVQKADFKPKTDTLINHQVYRKDNTVTAMKSAQNHVFWFDNPMDSVVFVGFKE